MTFGSKLPPDLNPISSEEFRRARKADYDRKLRKRELERMVGSGRSRSGAESSVAWFALWLGPSDRASPGSWASPSQTLCSTSTRCSAGSCCW
jgi:hypothetical protein